MDVHPPNFTTPVGRVRKYVPDLVQLPSPVDPESGLSYLWSDEEIQSFIEDESNGEEPTLVHILRAAAYICIATGNTEALIMKKLVTEDLQTDGPAVQKGFLGTANRLFDRADEITGAANSAEIFIDVPYTHSPPRYDWR